jgi:hypothetical protein
MGRMVHLASINDEDEDDQSQPLGAVHLPSLNFKYSASFSRRPRVNAT